MIKFNGKRTHCSDCKHLKINPFIHKLIGDCSGMRCELRDKIIGAWTFPDYCSKFESVDCAESDKLSNLYAFINRTELEIIKYGGAVPLNVMNSDLELYNSNGEKVNSIRIMLTSPYEKENTNKTNDEENTFEVQVKPYCHQCEDFEPKVLKIHRDGKIFRQYISCENSDKCKRIESYIRRT